MSPVDDDTSELLCIDECTDRLWRVPRTELVCEDAINSVDISEWYSGVVECNNDAASFITAEMLSSFFCKLRGRPARMFKTKEQSMLYTHAFSVESPDGEEMAARFAWPLSFYVHYSFYEKLLQTDERENGTMLHETLPWLEQARSLPPARCRPSDESAPIHRPRPSSVAGATVVRDWATALTRAERRFLLSTSTRPTMFRLGQDVSWKRTHVREQKRAVAAREYALSSPRIAPPSRQPVRARSAPTDPKPRLDWLPPDAFALVVESALVGALAEPDACVSRKSARALAGVARSFRDEVARQWRSMLARCRLATISFVERGVTTPIQEMLHVADSADAPAALRRHIYRVFGISPLLFERACGNMRLFDDDDAAGATGLLSARQRSKLSPLIREARAEVPAPTPLAGHASARLKKVIRLAESAPASPEGHR